MANEPDVEVIFWKCCLSLFGNVFHLSVFIIAYHQILVAMRNEL